MIIELPKSLEYVGGDIYVPSDEPFLTLTRIKNGAMLYSDKGSLLGQIFYDEKGATVSVANAGSYRVTYNLGKISIGAFSENASSAYEILGSAERYEYTLFEYKKGVRRPVEAASVTTSPLDDVFYKIKTDDSCNVFRSLMLVVAIGMLVRGENVKKKSARRR